MSMFKLSPRFLKNHRTLDCAAGASSFVPVLGNQGYLITALDPLYGMDYEAVKERSIVDFYTLTQAHTGMDDKVDWGFFQNSKNMIEERMKSCKKFVNDYKVFKGIRYIEGDYQNFPLTTTSFHLPCVLIFSFSMMTVWITSST